MGLLFMYYLARPVKFCVTPVFLWVDIRTVVVGGGSSADTATAAGGGGVGGDVEGSAKEDAPNPFPMWTVINHGLSEQLHSTLTAS